MLETVFQVTGIVLVTLIIIVKIIKDKVSEI
jgi:hypothetical protein